MGGKDRLQAGAPQVPGKRLMEEPLEDIVRDDPSLMFGLTRLRQDVNTWKQLSLKPYTAQIVVESGFTDHLGLVSHTLSVLQKQTP